MYEDVKATVRSPVEDAQLQYTKSEGLAHCSKPADISSDFDM